MRTVLFLLACTVGACDEPVDLDTDVGTETEPAPSIEPPFGDTSGGSGGADAASGSPQSVDGVSYQLLAPSGSASGDAVTLLLVVSGTEGANNMMSNMKQVAPVFGLDRSIIAVLDGRSASAADMAVVLDDVRAKYDVDNDRTWLMSESAGTRSGLALAFEVRPTYFAAYWANDVNYQSAPAMSAEELGFAPWGNAGPGGDYPDANAIVAGMRDAGWQLPNDAPYSGSGSGSHGSTDQFVAAVKFFADKTRQELD